MQQLRQICSSKTSQRANYNLHLNMEKQWEACCTNLILLDGKRSKRRTWPSFWRQKLKSRKKERREEEGVQPQATRRHYTARKQYTSARIFYFLSYTFCSSRLLPSPWRFSFPPSFYWFVIRNGIVRRIQGHLYLDLYVGGTYTLQLTQPTMHWVPLFIRG